VSKKELATLNFHIDAIRLPQKPGRIWLYSIVVQKIKGGNIMKHFKKILGVGIVALSLSVLSVTAFAASGYKTPAEAVAGLTGRTLQSVIDERKESKKSFGAIAAEAGSLDSFKAEMLEIKKDRLAAQVEAGKITQEEADAILAKIEENQAECDASGSGQKGSGHGFGKGLANKGRRRQGAGKGEGAGAGLGQGQRMRKGSPLK
jgi:hypothetical protein